MKTSQKTSVFKTPLRITIATLIAAQSFSVSSAETLEDLTVTTNRMSSATVLAPTTVITRADIERLQVTDLSSLLARQPGIDLATNGGAGKSTSIFMRGTNSDHVLVLIDGVKWRSATSGTPALQHLPIEQVERIEIVRGPRSGLYGAEAIGGVIQIFTRKGSQGFKPFAKVGYGSDNTRLASAGISGGDDATQYNFSASHQSTNGFDARSRDTTDPDDDGYRNNSVTANIQHKLSNKVKLGAHYTRAEGDNEYDDFSNTDKLTDESVQQVFGANLDLQLSDTVALELKAGESRDQSENFKAGANDGTFNTRYRYASAISRWNVKPNNTLSFGLDFETDHVDSTNDYAKNSRDNRAAFVSWLGEASKHSWLLSIRHDDNEEFGNYTSGSAEWGYWLNDGLQFTATIGTAFKAPTFNDLYFPATTFFVGNPDLEPEKSRSIGLGLAGFYDWGNWQVSAYETDVRDLLVYQFPKMVNVDEANIRGLEFDLNTDLMGWDIAFNVSILDPEDDETGNVLPRRARRLANLAIDKQLKDWSVGASWKVSGERYDNASNTTRLAGYAVVDVRASYHVAADWRIQANISNLFDRQYQTVNEYNSPDRAVLVTIVYN